MRGRKSPLFLTMIKKETIQELAQERIDELNAGIFIVDISVSSTNHIQIEVERESGSIAIEECVSISRNVEHNLDREEEDFSLQSNNFFKFKREFSSW